MRHNIEGKVIVITGACSGLGESSARHLALDGKNVVWIEKLTDEQYRAGPPKGTV